VGEPISLRRATSADADAIGVLTREAYAKWVPLVGRKPLPMTVDYAEAVKGHRFDLLFVGQALAALIETFPQGDELMIENVAVRPAFQKQGYGVRLLKLAEDLAGEAGLRGTRLYTNKLMDANVKLYAAMGYVIEGEETFGDRTAVHMTKPLARQA